LVRTKGDNSNAAIEYLGAEGSTSLLSYEEFHRRADVLAVRIESVLLSDSTTDHPFIVPILSAQGPELYIGLLSILKAGGAFCPLNLDAPPERVKFILKDISAKVVLCTRDLASKIPQDDHVSQISILLIDDENTHQTSVVSDFHYTRRPKASDPAYVMYTSGSTGTPKGVAISHDAVTQSLLAHDRHIPQFSRFLQFAAPTFDVSVFEIFFPFFRGSTLISCSREAMLDDLCGVINTMSVDTCELTPTVAGSLIRTRDAVPGLRLLLTIGEMLTPAVVTAFGGTDTQPGILWGMYGPTEAAIHCSVQPAFEQSSHVGNIGIPFDAVSSFIVKIQPPGPTTQELEILSIGDVGELVLFGPQLAIGYLNRPDQNSAAFVDINPYGRVYRTGDKARILSDGTMECLGRIADGQVKLRGQRIELGEVEQAALRTPSCQAAVAAVINGVLVLFCSPKDKEDLESLQDSVLQTCDAWLPQFMVPGVVQVMKDFARLPSGKIDRKGLVRDYEVMRKSEADEVDIDFKDDVERQLAKVVSEALDIGILPSTNLTAVGLDSINAIRIAALLRKSKIVVPATDILRARTISQLRVALSRQEREDQLLSSEAADIELSRAIINKIPRLHDQVEDIESLFPCTPLQTAMIAETMENPRAYCNWIQLAFPAHIDDSEIESWIYRLATSNGILRTGFIQVDDSFAQILWRSLTPGQVFSVEQLKYEFDIINITEMKHPFRVQIGPRTGEHKSVLLQIHHGLYDGWSIDILLSDLNKLYQQAAIPQRPGFSNLLKYYQSEIFSRKCDTARAFWSETLARYQPPSFPRFVDTVRPSNQTSSVDTVLDINPQNLRRVFSSSGLSLQVLFQASVVWLWTAMVGIDDIVIGTVTSGRTIPIEGIEEIVGPCISTIPSRTNISQARTIKDLLATIQAANRSAMARGELSLREIKKAAGLTPAQSLYDVLFAYQESLYTHERQDTHIKEVNHQDYLETKILVEVEPRAVDFTCRITYHLASVSEAIATLMVQQVRHLCLYILDNIDSDLLSLRQAIPAHLLSTYNLNPETYSGTSDLGLLVQAVSERILEEPKNQDANVIQHLGWPFQNISTIVLYRDSVIPVPLGCIGELCFGGDQVARGYLDMPELTKEKFINHDSFGRIYRSGNLGRMLPNGSLEIIGRADDQIKLRGHRVELEETNDNNDEQWTDSEAQISSILSSVLGWKRETLRRWTSFNMLGLDSISAIPLSQQLQKHFGHRVPVSVILRNPSIAQLARILEEKNMATQDRSIPDPSRLRIFSSDIVEDIKTRCKQEGNTVETVLPCTPLQEAMLASSMSRSYYLNKVLFRLKQDSKIMETYWRQMCKRHAILRTCFATTDNLHHPFAQVVLRDWQPEWHCFSLTKERLDDGLKMHTDKIIAATDTMKPPISFAIMRKDESVWLSFICHHALYDGVAMDRLLFEVEELSRGRQLTPAIPIEPFLEEALLLVPTAETFWRDMMADFNPAPPLRCKTDVPVGRQETRSVKLDIPLSEIIYKTQELGVSLLSLCQSSWAAMLSLILGVEDICFGNVVSGRSVPVDGIDRLVAPCFNTIPIRVNLKDTRRTGDLMKAMQELNPRILEYQFTPLRFVQNMVSHNTGQPLFDTLLLLQQHVKPLDNTIWELERDDGEMDVR
jgi:amino acid adenylation domain-containing protein